LLEYCLDWVFTTAMKLTWWPWWPLTPKHIAIHEIKWHHCQILVICSKYALEQVCQKQRKWSVLVLYGNVKICHQKQHHELLKTWPFFNWEGTFQCCNQLHMLHSIAVDDCTKEWWYEFFWVSSWCFSIEKWPEQLTKFDHVAYLQTWKRSWASWKEGRKLIWYDVKIKAGYSLATGKVRPGWMSSTRDYWVSQLGGTTTCQSQLGDNYFILC